jgi:Dihydrofolate reductase
MKRIKLYITTTIDGYIATQDGDLDWFREYPNPKNSELGYNNFMSGIDTIIIGGQTYRSLLCMDVVLPYRDKTTYIVSHNPIDSKANHNIQSLTENIIEEIAKMKEEVGNDIGLLGGGELTKMLLQHDLIDEMTITTVPVLLGGGIPLFPPFFPISDWHIEKTELLENGMIQTVYLKKAL